MSLPQRMRCLKELQGLERGSKRRWLVPSAQAILSVTKRYSFVWSHLLGEKLGEFRGKVTGQRVLTADGSSPKVETSFEVNGTILGVEATIMGTYWSTVRPDGMLYGECPKQGIIMTRDGEVGTWTGAGVGRFTGRGAAVSFRGTVYFQIAQSSPAAAKDAVARGAAPLGSAVSAPRRSRPRPRSGAPRQGCTVFPAP
jgi:hypothetical protein